MILTLYFSSASIYAFEWNKCYKGILEPTLGIGVIASTTSYISSTGDCSAIAYHSKENKEMYYVQNKLELQLDIAKGEGPYLAELSSIYGCSDIFQVNKTLMKNYQSIYESEKPSNAIDSVMKTQNCKYL